jgi:hypothetical protein
VFDINRQRAAASDTPFRPPTQVLNQDANASNQSIIQQSGGDSYLIIQGRTYLRLRKIGAAELTDPRTCFTPPSGYSRALDIIRSSHAAVLIGLKDSGRRTAALRLLIDLGQDPLFELIPDFERPSADKLPLVPKQGYLIDLTDVDQAPSELFGRELIDYAHRLQANGSFLVLLTTSEIWQACRAPAAGISVDLGMPEAVELVRQRLVVRHAGERVGWFEQPPLAELIRDGQRPAELVELAIRISQVDDSDKAREDMADELQRWTRHLGSFEPNLDVRARALLIAAALLNEAPATVILNASDRLLSEVRVGEQDGGPLAGPDFKARLREIKADRDGDTISITKSRRMLDQAVLDHVWVERPQLRGVLVRWMGAISASQGAADRYADRIAHALAQLSIRQGTTDVLGVIEEWTAADSVRRRLAAQVLDELSVSRQVGARVRARMREWLESQRPSEGKMRVVAEVCGGSLGEQRPQVALHRLRLIFAQQESEDAREAAATALRKLTGNDSLCWVVLREVQNWIESDATRPAGLVAFLALVDLAPEDTVARQLLKATASPDGSLPRGFLSAAWTALLPRLEQVPGAERILRQWVETDDSAVDKALMVEVLGPAFKQEGLLSAVERVLLGWEIQSSEQRPVRSVLLAEWRDWPGPSVRVEASGSSAD